MDRRVTRSMKGQEAAKELERKKLERERILLDGNIIRSRTKALEKVRYPLRRRLTRGMVSAKGNAKAMTWTCLNCNKVNRPERRLLAILPVIRCECGEESNVQFDFSLHKLEINDHFCIPNIRKQEGRECSPCSMLALAEISWCVNAMLDGQVLRDNEPFLDKIDLLEKYSYLCDVCEIEKKWNQTAVQTMLEVISTIGVQSKVEKGEKPKVYKLPFYSAVKKDFSAICRLLADGYPIRTSLFAGKNLSHLQPGKIYKAPGRRGRHAVVLIGAGRRGSINYYHFLNSWGKYFCRRIRTGVKVSRVRLRSSRRDHRAKKACGGFGMLRASDIRARPVTFLRHEDDKEFYKPLLHEDIVPDEGLEEASIPCWRAPQPLTICSKTSDLSDSICQKMQEGSLPIDCKDQVLVSLVPKHQVFQCSPGDDKAACAAGDENELNGEEREEKPVLGLTSQPWQIYKALSAN